MTTAAAVPDMGERPRVPVGRAVVVLALSLFEAVLFPALVQGHVSARSFAFAHLGICAAVAAIGAPWACRARRQGGAAERCATVLHWSVWTLLGGPFGALLCALLLIPQRTAAPATASGEPTHDELGPTRASLTHGRLLDKRLRLTGASRIQPLFDVMLEGRLPEKLNALILVSKHYAPDMASVLKRALQDGDASVRVLAATVTARQHNVHTSRIGALQEAAADATAEQLDRWRELAEARLAYARSGMLDGARADAETAQAHEDLGRTGAAGAG